jgi:hypothetical protein
MGLGVICDGEGLEKVSLKRMKVKPYNSVPPAKQVFRQTTHTSNTVGLIRS